MKFKEPQVPLKIETAKKIIETSETERLERCIQNHELNAKLHKQGGNAEIYTSPNPVYKNICLKKIKDRPQILYNNVDNEMSFQIKVRALGIKTPLPLLSVETKDGRKFILMEFIKGETVSDILNKPSLLPKKFNYEVFCKAPEEAVAKMHQAGIYHRDLHSKNVMIEKSTGLPVIIDFGTATEGSGSDLTYSESISLLNPTTGRYEMKSGFFKDDDEMVRNIKASLRGINKLPTRLTNEV